MKNKCLIFIFLCVTSTLLGQSMLNLKVAKAQNHDAPIYNAAISYKGSNNRYIAIGATNTNGTLRYKSPKKAGERLRLSIKKTNWQVVNYTALYLIIKKGEQDYEKILMCPNGYRNVYAVKYYQIKIDDLTAREYNRQRQALERQHKKDLRTLQATITDQATRLIIQDSIELVQFGQLMDLSKKYDQVKQINEDLARQLADTTNLENVSDLYQLALSYYLQGQLDSVLTILDDKIIEARNEVLDAKITQKEKEIAELKQAKKQAALDYLLKAKTYLAKLNFDQAEKYYQKAYQKDSLSYDVLFEIGEFYYNQKRYSLALPYLQGILHNKLYKNDYGKSIILNNLGLLYDAIKVYQQAEMKHLEAEKIRRELSKKEKMFLSDLASTLNNLGNLYHSIQNYQQAEVKHLEAEKIRRELSKKEKTFRADLASTLNNLGNLYWGIQDYKQAEVKYLEAEKIYRELSKNEKAFRANLASTLNNLGVLYRSIQAYEQTKSKFLEAEKIYRALSKNEKAFRVDLASTLNNLGVLYHSIQAYKQAKDKYLEAEKIRRTLSKNEKAFRVDLASTLNNLGALYSNIQAYEQAEGKFLEAEKIRRELSKNEKAFRAELATTLNNLGNLYSSIQDYEQAEVKHLEAEKIRRELSKKEKAFRADLASTLNNLGILYFSINQPQKALAKLQGAINIRRPLAAQYPSAFDLDLVQSLGATAGIYQSLNQKDSMITYLQEAAVLVAKYPDNPQAQGLAAAILQMIEQEEQPTEEKATPLQLLYQRIQTLQQSLSTIPKDADKVAIQQAITIKYDSLLAALPDNARVLREAAGAYGNLAWYQLFARDFEGAIIAAQRGLVIDSTQQWINTNLASAYLLGGAYQKAKAIYKQYKDKPWSESGSSGEYATFGEVFLEDLAALEAAGITHKKVRKMRKLLRK